MTGFVGAILGATGVSSIGGVIVTKYGWPALFYVSAVMTLLWAITWPGNIYFIENSLLKSDTILVPIIVFATVFKDCLQPMNNCDLHVYNGG